MAPPSSRPALQETTDEKSQRGPDPDETQTLPEEADPREMKSLPRILLTLIICLGLFLAYTATSIVSTALVSISAQDQNYQDATGVALGYLLTYMSFALGFSNLGETYGPKNSLAIAWSLFILGSLWCQLAGSTLELIAGRALQGVGGSGLYSLAHVCLAELWPGVVGNYSFTSIVLYPLRRSHSTIQGGNWRDLFWFNIPYGILAMLGICTLWPQERRNRHDALTALFKTDLVGKGLRSAAWSFLVSAIMRQIPGSFLSSWSSTFKGCSESWIYSFFLGAWEPILFRDRSLGIQLIIPMGLARNRVYISALLSAYLGAFVPIALVIKVPEFLQIVHGDSAFWAGVHMLPMLGGCVVGSSFGRKISERVKPTSQALIAGNMLLVVGLGLVFTFSRGLGLRLLLGFTFVHGAGIGLSFAACTMIAATEADDDDLAAAQGAMAWARVFGGVVVLALSNVAGTPIFKEQMRLRTSSGSNLGQHELHHMHRIFMVIWAHPFEPKLTKECLPVIYLEVFRDQMLVLLIAAGLALLVSLGTYRSKPRHGRLAAGQAAEKT